jgi:AcrR family transcriptional regulator
MAAKASRPADPPRRRGRPRSPAVDRGILTATVEVVAEVGYKLATLELIAARAGVGTATIYRRYHTKRELVSAALHEVVVDFRPPGTGDVREDLATLLHRLASGLRPPSTSRVLAAMAFTDPELHEVGWAAMAKPRRAVLAEVVRDGIKAGQLRADLDVNVFVEVLSAVPIWSELMRHGRGFTLRRAYAVVDLLLAGAAPADA